MKFERSKALSSEKSEIERIKEDIEASGVPLEVKTSEILRKNSWFVEHQSYYFDEQEEKHRYVDLVANKTISTRGNDFFDAIYLYLIIECKKGVKPWVFYTIKEYEYGLFSPIKKELNVIPYTFYVKTISKPKNTKNYSQKIIDLAGITHYSTINYDRIGLIPHVAFIKKDKENGRDDLFEAKNQVIKSLVHQKIEYEQNLDHFGNVLFLFYPIIVFDGNLFQWEKELDISPTDYVQYKTFYPISERQIITEEQYYGYSFPSECYLIEVMKHTFFPNYLRIIEKELEDLKKLFAK